MHRGKRVIGFLKIGKKKEPTIKKVVFVVARCFIFFFPQRYERRRFMKNNNNIHKRRTVDDVTKFTMCKYHKRIRCTECRLKWIATRNKNRIDEDRAMSTKMRALNLIER